jgi:two-component system nitrogen regulation sensor histidine kinase NtrY
MAKVDGRFDPTGATAPSLLARAAGTMRAFLFALAISATLVLFLVLTGLIEVQLDQRRVAALVIANAVLAGILLLVVIADVVRLVRARRRNLAGARTQTRLVLLFTMVAAVPTVLISVVASVTLERGLNPWFSGAVRDLVTSSQTIATGFQQQLCQNVGREMRLIANDVDRARTLGLFETQRTFVRELLTNRGQSLGFPYVAVVTREGAVIERADINAGDDPRPPRESDFAEADTPEPPCIITSRYVGALVRLPSIPGGYLYVARPVDPRALTFGQVADLAVEQYQVLDTNRSNVLRAFMVMYALISLTLLLSVIWIGLTVANRLVEPIRRLILATDQVAEGNLYVQVPVQEDSGDTAHLGRTFNNMTARIRAQQNRLMAASELIDQRRRFTEAVLSGVSVGVIGLDGEGVVNVANPAALAVLSREPEDFIGRRLSDLVPEFAELLDESGHPGRANAQRQVAIRRSGIEKTLLVRATAEHQADTGQGLIVTLDDITDLMTAQRTSAWADVARRIAHEIKNPLTPIQLSAERIKRKYGRVITEDREVFDQCTATIIRQVDDIRRMVDEFSSFARMPKPAPQNEDIVETLRQALFLMRVAHPGVGFVDNLPDWPVIARFDRRLIGQAVQNVLKNATEAIAGSPPVAGLTPAINLFLTMGDDRVVHIDIIDNGKGFPVENRQRLLEPYMTDRAGGTGLGLAIVAKILEDHGGGIQLLDSPEVASGGRGARVRLSFPQNGPAEADPTSFHPGQEGTALRPALAAEPQA